MKTANSSPKNQTKAAQNKVSLSNLAQPKVVLPFMIFMAVFIVGVRLNDFFNTLINGHTFHPVSQSIAMAKDAEAATPPSAPAAKPEPAAADSDSMSRAKSRSADNDEISEVDPALLRQLAQRRIELEKRSKDLDVEAELIHVGEERVNRKIKEMETLRAQLQILVNQANAEQQAQLDNLVKIYETMKPKEAARIFETLELPVLLGVIEKMKPTRTAPVMAEMTPEKAKEITIALTNKNQLPQLDKKDQMIGAKEQLPQIPQSR